MIALIDADILIYMFASSTEQDGVTPTPWAFVQTRLRGTINYILEATEATSHKLYLTSRDESNFRLKEATIKPYKGNRANKEKPHYYDKIRETILRYPETEEVFGMEADDALGIAQSNALPETTIICSTDKDLDMIPGLHYNWTKDEIYKISDLEAIRNFYKQLLTGDSVDNIPGLFGVGKKSNCVKRIDTYEDEKEMYKEVSERYKERFGSYWQDFFYENASLLWIKREEPKEEGREEQFECSYCENQGGFSEEETMWTEEIWNRFNRIRLKDIIDRSKL